ncbi:MAG: L-fucose:H+ symporter permease [Candidatus Marinimicrobia bacterium]|nr:L-fucose:H+ symporter permease [Candidatus Neomarinimicrobiota bacterium]
MTNKDSKQGTIKSDKKVIPRKYLLPFILVTSCFALWGFANDITNPLVKAFSRVLMMSNFQGSLVQFAFYGGYFAMAFPAAMFIKKFSYKSGLLVGLGLYATGALLFIPASMIQVFGLFLIAYFILTCGLSFLETTSNPYILSMGPEETSTQRLNFAQAFNPIGSLTGMFIAQQLILAKLHPATASERAAMASAKLKEVTTNDLAVIRTPYVFMAFILIAVLILVAITKMPGHGDKNKHLNLKPTLKRLFSNQRYLHGVIAQFFYVAAQIMCWTFIIHYGTEVFTSPEFGMSVAKAEVLSQKYNIVAMGIFTVSRFINTFLLKYFRPGKLLMNLAIGAITLTLGTIIIPGIVGLYCLVGISACMSLMFPTIYGIALKGLGEDAKIGAAGLIMAILGGSVMPPMQGAIIDLGQVGPLSGVRASFVLTLLCFIVITHYGFKTYHQYIELEHG